MTFLQMSLSGAILILVIAVVRAVAISRLPKRTFVALWCVVLLRIFVPLHVTLPIEMPFALPFEMPLGISSIEISSLAPNAYVSEPGVDTSEHIPPRPEKKESASDTRRLDTSEHISPHPPSLPAPPQSPFPTVPASPQAPRVPVLPIIWASGAVIFALNFLITHVFARREYAAALPVDNEFLRGWLRKNALRRRLQIRISDKIHTPLTYGIFRPVILLAKTTDFADAAALEYVLTHEITHIRRFDIVQKWLLAAALCVHWFNPAVWLMYVLASRDIEVSCDEAVLRKMGDGEKSAYALTLVALEEKRGGLSPLYNYFAKNAIKERIDLIMKTKKRTIFASIAAVALVFVLAAAAFAAVSNGNGGYGGYNYEGDEIAANYENFRAELSAYAWERINAGDAFGPISREITCRAPGCTDGIISKETGERASEWVWDSDSEIRTNEWNWNFDGGIVTNPDERYEIEMHRFVVTSFYCSACTPPDCPSDTAIYSFFWREYEWHPAYFAGTVDGNDVFLPASMFNNSMFNSISNFAAEDDAFYPPLEPDREPATEGELYWGIAD
ncbi:MAG: M56 family metallopeptidase [Defluviitaleaceae bacterium]|nr:M56 family metallopeptidase [Defluviitaleaceae bacterium]